MSDPLRTFGLRWLGLINRQSMVVVHVFSVELPRDAGGVGLLDRFRNDNSGTQPRLIDLSTHTLSVSSISETRAAMPDSTLLYKGSLLSDSDDLPSCVYILKGTPPIQPESRLYNMLRSSSLPHFRRAGSEPNAKAIESLKLLGYSNTAAQKALLLNRWDCGAALDWLLSRNKTSGINDALSPQQLAQVLLSLGNPGTPPPVAAVPDAPHDGHIDQYYQHCYTCNLTGTQGCCLPCARTCHKDHELSWVKYSPDFSCDCHDQCPLRESNSVGK